MPKDYTHRREPLSREEEDRLVNACKKEEEKLIVWTFLDSGLRISEFQKLNPENIQWQENRLIVMGKGGPRGHMTKRRVVPLSDRSRRLLELHFASKNDIGICNRTIQRVIRRVANRARISKKVSPHVLRHTFAIRCIQKGISTRALQEFLGHNALSTTEWYLNLSPEEALEEFQRKW